MGRIIVALLAAIWLSIGCARERPPVFSSQMEFVRFTFVRSFAHDTEITFWRSADGSVNFEAVRVSEEGEDLSQIVRRNFASGESTEDVYLELVRALESPRLREMAPDFPDGGMDGDTWIFEHHSGAKILRFVFWEARSRVDQPLHDEILALERLFRSYSGAPK